MHAIMIALLVCGISFVYLRIGKFVGAYKWRLTQQPETHSFSEQFFFPLSSFGWLSVFQDRACNLRVRYGRYIDFYEAFDKRYKISRTGYLILLALVWPLSIIWGGLWIIPFALYRALYFCLFGWSQQDEDGNEGTTPRINMSSIRIAEPVDEKILIAAKVTALHALEERREQTEEAISLLSAELELEEELRAPSAVNAPQVRQSH